MTHAVLKPGGTAITELNVAKGTLLHEYRRQICREQSIVIASHGRYYQPLISLRLMDQRRWLKERDHAMQQALGKAT